MDSPSYTEQFIVPTIFIVLTYGLTPLYKEAPKYVSRLAVVLAVMFIVAMSYGVRSL